jgi:hypothetical protein
MDIPVLRNTVGVRNPFALAEVKLGKKIDWRNTSAEKQRKIIERSLGASYAEIFDSTNTNPAFLHPVKSGSGDATQCDKEKINSLIQSSGPNPQGSNYSSPAGAVGNFDDPVQGALSDCYFIAALTSISFASATKNLISDRGSGPSYNYTFYNTNGPIITNGNVKITHPLPDTPVTVNNSVFPLAKGNLVFARSKTPGEIWPAVYEKAFAAWKNGGSTDTPDYSKLCLGNPVTALANITGWDYSSESVFDTLTFLNNPAMIYDKIAKVCDNPSIPAKPYDRRTKFPVIAYTYDSIKTPGGKVYSDPTIVRNHSYSVLGVRGVGTERYIVMRNPWGQTPPPVYYDPLRPYGDPQLSGVGVLSTGSWMNITTLEDASDGIFALNVKQFQDYFQAFGWVYH